MPAQFNQSHISAIISLAEKNVAQTGLPFSAMILDEKGEILSTGVNQESECYDCTAHAEIQAIRGATKKCCRLSLEGTTLIASGEPCALCYMAMYVAKISHIVILTDRHQASAYGFNYLPSYDNINAQLLDNFSITYLQNSDAIRPFKQYQNTLNQG